MPQTVRLLEVWPGVYRVHAKFDKRLNELIKMAGDQQAIYWFDFRAELGKKYWYIPLERLDEFSRTLHMHQYVCEIKHAVGLPLKIIPDDLLPHQRAAAEAALMLRVRLLQFDTGLGKSLTAMAVATNCEGKTLIVAPRIVLSSWPKEIEKWCLLDGGSIWEQRSGRKIPDEQPDVTLCSYGSLHNLPDHWRYGCMIYDEIHYAIHAGSKRSAELRKLSICNPKGVRLGLTATPTSAETHNIFGVLHALCPHRYGKWWQWSRKYHVITPTGWEGRDEVGPLREDRKEDLAETLVTITSVATQADVGYDKLPPVTWDLQRLKNTVHTSGPARDKAGWLREQQALSGARAIAVSNRLASESFENTAIVCYFRSTAAAIGESLGLPVISGDMPPHQRAAALQDSSAAVITMKSANEGIDLRKFTTVYIVEAYPVPCYMEQITGRFIRMYATDPVKITFMALENTSDVIVCAKLAERLQEQAAVNTANTTRSKLLDLMTSTQKSDTWFEDLATQLDDADWSDAGDDEWE